MAAAEHRRSVFRAMTLIIAACCCQPAAAQSDEDDAAIAAIAADIEMAKIVSAAARAAIEEIWRNTHAFPADRQATGMSPTPTDTRAGPVAALDVTDGHVLVTFGEEAHPSLTGKTVVFSPKVTPEQTIEWARNQAREIPPEDNNGLLRLPVEVVGSTLASWQDFLGPGMEPTGPELCRGENTVEPIVCYGLTGNRTEVHFLKNLSSGREFLIYLESGSQALLSNLGANAVPLGKDRLARFEECWDAGCDTLEVLESPDGARSATWSYYVD